jgi:hypothetical protein
LIEFWPVMLPAVLPTGPELIKPDMVASGGASTM